MRFLVGFISVFVGIIFVQSAPVVHEVNIQSLSEDIDVEQVALKFANLLEKYLGSSSQNFLKKRQIIAIEGLNDLKGVSKEVDEFLAMAATMIPEDQYKLFEQELLQIFVDASTGDKDSDAIETELMNLVEKYFGSGFGSRFDFQTVVHKLVKNIGSTLFNMVKGGFKKRQVIAVEGLNDLKGLNGEFGEFLDMAAAVLPKDQYKLFEQELLQIFVDASSGDIDSDAIEAKWMNILEKYFGSDFESRFDFQPTAHKFVKTIGAALFNLVKGA